VKWEQLETRKELLPAGHGQNPALTVLYVPYSLGSGPCNVRRFRGGLVFKAHRLLHHSTLGSRVMKKRRRRFEARDGREEPLSREEGTTNGHLPGGQGQNPALTLLQRESFL